MLVIDKLCYCSKLRYVNPGEKCSYSMITIVFAIASRSIYMAVFIMLLNHYLTVYKGGINGRRYVKLMMVPLTFLVLSTIAIIVNISKTPLDAYAFEVGTYYITGSYDGIWQGCQLIGTAMASVSSLYFLSLNTTMPDIVSTLAKFRLPKVVVELMMLIYRYIFILLNSAAAITISQKSRLGHKDYRTSLKSFGTMLSAVFIQSMKRSSILFDAMEARGYTGQLNVLEEHHDYDKMTAFLISTLGVILLGITVYIKLKGIKYV